MNEHPQAQVDLENFAAQQALLKKERVRKVLIYMGIGLLLGVIAALVAALSFGVLPGLAFLLGLGFMVFAPGVLMALLYPLVALGRMIMSLARFIASYPWEMFFAVLGMLLLVASFLLPLLFPVFFAALSGLLTVFLPILALSLGILALGGVIIAMLRNGGWRSANIRMAALLAIGLMAAASIMVLGPILGFAGLFFAGTFGLAALAMVVAFAPVALLFTWRAIKALAIKAIKDPLSALMLFGVLLFIAAVVASLFLAGPAFIILSSILFALGAIAFGIGLIGTLIKGVPPWKDRPFRQKALILLGFGLVIGVGLFLFATGLAPILLGLIGLFAPLAVYMLGIAIVRSLKAIWRATVRAVKAAGNYIANKYQQLCEWVRNNTRLVLAIVGILLMLIALFLGLAFPGIVAAMLFLGSVGALFFSAAVISKIKEVVQKNAIETLAFIAVVGVFVALLFFPLSLAVAIFIPAILFIGGLLVTLRRAEEPPRPLTRREIIILALVGGLLLGLLVAFLLPLVISGLATGLLIAISVGVGLLPLAVYGVYGLLNVLRSKAIYVFGLMAIVGAVAAFVLLPGVLLAAGVAFLTPFILPFIPLLALGFFALGWLIRRTDKKNPLSNNEKAVISILIAIAIGVAAFFTGGLILALVLGPVALVGCASYAARKWIVEKAIQFGRWFQAKALRNFGAIAILGMVAAYFLLPMFGLLAILPFFPFLALLVVGLGFLIRRTSGEPLSIKEKAFISFCVTAAVFLTAFLLGSLVIGIFLAPIVLALCVLFINRKFAAKYPILSGFLIGMVALASLMLIASFLSLAFLPLLGLAVVTFLLPLLIGLIAAAIKSGFIRRYATAIGFLVALMGVGLIFLLASLSGWPLILVSIVVGVAFLLTGGLVQFFGRTAEIKGTIAATIEAMKEAISAIFSFLKGLFSGKQAPSKAKEFEMGDLAQEPDPVVAADVQEQEHLEGLDEQKGLHVDEEELKNLDEVVGLDEGGLNKPAVEAVAVLGEPEVEPAVVPLQQEAAQNVQAQQAALQQAAAVEVEQEQVQPPLDNKYEEQPVAAPVPAPEPVSAPVQQVVVVEQVQPALDQKYEEQAVEAAPAPEPVPAAPVQQAVVVEQVQPPLDQKYDEQVVGVAPAPALAPAPKPVPDASLQAYVNQQPVLPGQAHDFSANDQPLPPPKQVPSNPPKWGVVSALKQAGRLAAEAAKLVEDGGGLIVDAAGLALKIALQ